MPSTPANQTPPAVTVLRYGDHPEQLADLRLPTGPTDDTADGSTRAPLVLVVHGGNWKQQYDRTTVEPMCEALAAAGYASASLEYRRVGPGGSGGTPETFDDIATAVDTVPALADAAAPGRVDPDRVVLLGHSAGGHLALWATVRHVLPAGSRWARPRPANLLGVVAQGAVTDLGSALRHSQGDGSVDELVAGCADAGVSVDELDPARWPGHGVPTVLVHGDADEDVPVRWSVEHAERLRDAGTPVDLQVLPGTGHFEPIDPQTAAWLSVLASVERLAQGVTTL